MHINIQFYVRNHTKTHWTVIINGKNSSLSHIEVYNMTKGN